MLLKGLSRPQLRLQVWTVRNLAFVQQRTLSSSSQKPDGGSQSADGRTLTLFEELFPEESKKLEKAKRSSTNTGEPQVLQRDEVRRSSERVRSTQYPRPFKPVKHLAADSKRPPLPSNAQQDPIQDVENAQHQFREHRNASVLILSNASKSLSLSDFLRLSPQGEHIDGWASGIIKVIPARNHITLEPQGNYFILFSSDAAARAYMDNLQRIHRIAKTYTPNSITSPLPPPPGYLRDGEDLHALMHAYTLVPASQPRVSIRMLKKPLRPAMQRLVAAGGYATVVARQRGAEEMVLLSLDKGRLSVFDLRAAIGRDGRHRNLQWRLLPVGDDIVRLEGGKAVSDEGGMTETEPLLQDGDGQKRRTGQPPRFILSFMDNQEARRFVRAWHRRPFPLTQGPPNPGDEGPPIVNAELLW